jgi:hypothetical protein
LGKHLASIGAWLKIEWDERPVGHLALFA